MTTTTTTLADFLLARIEEDEATWRQVLGGARRAGKSHAGQHLADLEAHRRIVTLYQRAETADDRDTQGTLGRVLRILAAIYMLHPDYQETFR